MQLGQAGVGVEGKKKKKKKNTKFVLRLSQQIYKASRIPDSKIPSCKKQRGAQGPNKPEFKS